MDEGDRLTTQYKTLFQASARNRTVAATDAAEWFSRDFVAGNSGLLFLSNFNMDDPHAEQEKRWFRVVETCPIFRLVDIQATSESEAQEMYESLRDDQFIQTDEDDWLLETLMEISDEDVMNPLE